ncbi:MAG TPA: alpha-2-macroglobulin family protein [Pyrinomonadaceae bacterium]|jgi:hypothetical protein
MLQLRRAASVLLIIANICGAVSPALASPVSNTRARYESHDAALHVDEDAGRAPSGDATDVENEGEERQQNPGLKFRLSEGAEQAETRPPTAAFAPAVRLSESETQNVLKRLPPLKTETDDEKDFALRERSLPPPRTGKIVEAIFPPPVQAVAPDTKASVPLEVLRFAPTGDVPIAPQLSITFSQPMVAIKSRGELAAEEVPVELTPQPRGNWRWLGTKTLVFDALERFPMATHYTATVRAGTKSANGGTLAVTTTWNFSTPPPQLKTTYPNEGTHRRDAVIFIEFDQLIDAAAVLGSVRVRGGSRELKTRLATPAEIEADAEVRRLASAAQKGRWLALRASDSPRRVANADSNANNAGDLSQMPVDEKITVTVAAGAPSAEGTRRTDKPQAFSFRTYGPLRVVGRDCGYEKICTPNDEWEIVFSNLLDAKSFDKSQLRIEPGIQSLTSSIHGNTLSINGMKRGRRIYRVTLPRTLRDQFGQTLSSDAVLSFNVAASPPQMFASGSGFVVLEPSASPRYAVYSTNLNRFKVRLYAVGIEDWARFNDYMNFSNGYGDASEHKQQTPPGRLISSKTIEVRASPDEMVETNIDLRPALGDNGRGNVVVVVESLSLKRDEQETLQAWVQVTGIGLDAFVDGTDLLGWATSLSDGSPLADVEMSIYPNGASGRTGSDGLARLSLQEQARQGAPLLLARRRDGEEALLPESFNWWNRESGWYKKNVHDALRWYVFDDRKMYRPGEEVHIKGWLRRAGGGKNGDVGALGDAAASVAYKLRDVRGNEIKTGTLALNALGGFDTVIKLPATMNLGSSALMLEAQGGRSGEVENRSHTHGIQVQEFRRPEFEVSSQTSEGPHIIGGHAISTVTASYYAGGALADAEVSWHVAATPGNFTPPNRDDYTFGTWVPWWESNSRTSGGSTQTQNFTSRTDASGKHRLRLDFDAVAPARPSNVTAYVRVSDVNRQTWADTTRILVHPSELYVGVRSPRTFVQQGESLIVEGIVTDLDGRAVSHREISMRAALLDWVYEDDRWQQKETNAQECNVKSAGDAVKCTFQTKEGGVYRVRASVFDDRERRNESELLLWVAGGKLPPQRGVEQERVELIPDRREFRAGETAEVLVRTPFYPAEGVLTLRRSGLIRTERFRMDSPSHTLKIPIEEGWTPNIFVQVNLVGAATRTDDAGNPNVKLPKRPAFASGEINLPVPPLARRLTVAATPRDKALEPGAETTVDVEVRDAGGRPVVGGEMAVVVVDEAVLALTQYRLADPLEVFYAQRSEDVTDYHLRSSIVLDDPAKIDIRVGVGGVGAGGVGGGGAGAVAEAVTVRGGLASQAAPRRRSSMLLSGKFANAPIVSQAIEAEEIRLRENFNALAVFAPSVRTDARGRVEVKVKLPDNLTRYRVMAVSVAGDKQFGSGESTITARMPLMARLSAPRFLNFGDHFELPVVVQNQTDKPLSVDVAVRAANAELTEGAGRRVNVPANERVEVRFPASAARVGVARFQVGAVGGEWSDAAEVQLPVWTPATTEAFATYGEIDAGSIVQPIKAPSGVVKQFGGLEITTSSTQLQALTDAMLYLMAYPFECSEQLSSRVLAVAALRDVLTAFEAKGMPKPDEMLTAVARDIKRLQAMQNDDGGFGFWRRGEESWPYISIHVAHALARAKEKKFAVPDEMLAKSLRYLRNVERHIPARYSRDTRQAIIAYALYVRNRLGDRDAARARSLINGAGLENLSLEAVGWLLSVLSGDAASSLQVENIRRLLNNRAEETAATAHFTTRYTDGQHLLLHSERRADGIILEALIGDQPASDLIPKIVRGLLAHRKAGRWHNTQENVFILLALDRYFATYEKATPDFVARAWLGESFAGGQEFRGRSTDSQRINVPMQALAEQGGAHNLVLSKEGAGRLYYRVGLQYAPASLKLDAADYGFAVERVYEAIDDAADVRRDTDGTWHIKAGSRVRVRLTMVAPARRYHVALVDPLPAGLEALNAALAVTGNIPPDEKAVDSTRGGRGWWWHRSWFEHQNLRDERAEAFTTLLQEGVHTYSYVARATTPGVFVVPPPKAEEMYQPETFGRGSTDHVRIE